MSFAKLKSNSKTKFEDLKAKLASMKSGGRTKDERYWKPELDKQGNGSAVIRFLPTPSMDDEGSPWVRIYNHAFKGPGGWYIENSLTTFGYDNPDPAAEMVSSLWDLKTPESEALARERGRKLHHISNVYIVRDKAHPENEGKVFLFRYGKKIFEKLKEKMDPSDEDDTAMNPFDLWTGANFKLKIRKVDDYPNYDMSEFDAPGPLFKDDGKLEEIYNAEYSLQELLDPKHFKSYDELNVRLQKVLKTKPKSSILDEEPSTEAPSHKAKELESSGSWEDDDDDDDDAFARLRRIASED